MNNIVKEETLGQRIRAARIRKEMTHEELAELMLTTICTIAMMRREYEVFDSFLNALKGDEYLITYKYIHKDLSAAKIGEEIAKLERQRTATPPTWVRFPLCSLFQDSMGGRASASYAEGYGIMAHSWDSFPIEVLCRLAIQFINHEFIYNEINLQ